MDLRLFSQLDYLPALRVLFEKLNVPMNYVAHEPTTSKEILKDIYKDNDTFQLMHYFFPVEVCKFILSNTVFNENEGKYEFMDFEREHQSMARLFENFIFNYYKRHLVGWKVQREKINWNVEEGGIGVDFLPEMRTDITLESPERKMVIDAKFYQEPMKGSFPGSVKKFASANLYQLNTYLMHLAGNYRHKCNATAEGMLLYPVLQAIERLDVNFSGHRIRIESIDLNQSWRKIGESLEDLVG